MDGTGRTQGRLTKMGILGGKGRDDGVLLGFVSDLAPRQVGPPSNSGNQGLAACDWLAGQPTCISQSAYLSVGAQKQPSARRETN